ncbi:hypothetical protein CC2G_010913 [Coprinopsis cinerea AmutBmut pab1-1]|nr:hypothetical protein CC2G_010913 [Coprinopsis cinerea AmutBmut pab1-1]
MFANSRTWLALPLFLAAATHAFPSNFDLPLDDIFAVEKRQTANVPTVCREICQPINALAAGGCRPSECCNQQFLDGYVNCYICTASRHGVTAHTGAQNIVRNIARQCAVRGFELEIPPLPSSGPLTWAPPGSTPIIPSSTISGTSRPTESSDSISPPLSSISPTSDISTPTALLPTSEIEPSRSTIRPSVESPLPSPSNVGDGEEDGQTEDGAAASTRVSFLAAGVVSLFAWLL